MADYTITLDADPRQVLQAFRQMEQDAQRTGQVIGERLDQGVQRFSTTSLAGLQAELNRLQQKQLTVGVNTAAFDKLGQRINEVRAQLDAASRKQLSIGVDDRSIAALQTRLGTLQSELNRVAIGSQRFRELQGAIEATNRELAKAGESADGFRLLDGVVQGVAFSLSNSVVNAAGSAFQALQSVVSSYARLDTELRQAAAADGGAGAYDKIAASVDRVGIEAAGSTQDVAKLATELIRGGMSADQVNASLGAIVRGAEATGTGYAQMGSNVSAALKGFGLAAGDAQRVVDALVTGANASATSVEGMGMAFKYSAPVAKILGISIEDLGVAVGLLTNAGIDASEAGVTLRNGLSKLASAAPQTAGSTQQLSGQAAEAAKAMRTLGVNIYNADGTLKPMRETLLALKGAFDKLGPSAKIRLAASMFGGEDDGTKWLALLNQSNEEINKMADTMAKTAGATDKARDAMQGFELLTKQVDGTIGSLGNVLGKITVAVLTPFVEVANGVLGVLSGLPGPVKEGVAAFTLLTGGIIAATAAAVIYQRVMASAIGQKAIAEVVALGGAFRTTLANGIATAAARLPALIGGMAALALRMGYLILAFKTWEAVTGSSDRVGQGFNDRLKETQKALDSITPAAEKANKSLELTGAQKFRQDMNGILNFVENFSRAADLNAITDQTGRLQAAFTQVQESALKTFQALKGATALTGDQRKEISDRIAALKVVKEQAEAQAKAYRDLAASYSAAGKDDMAQIATRNANAMQVEVDASTRLIAGLNGIQAKTEGVNTATIQAISLTNQLAQVTRERIAVESQLQGINNQIETGQALLNISTALQQREQARSSLAKASLDYQISKVTERYDKEIELMQRGGFTERQIADAKLAKDAEIKRLKDQQDQADRQMIAYKAQAMEQEQQMARAMLLLNQEKARDEANLEALTKRGELLKLQGEQAKAKTDQERAEIQKRIELKNQEIEISQNKLSMLGKTQPMERAALGIQQDAARATLQAEGASKGVKVQVDAITKSGIDKQFGSVASNMRAAAGDAKTFYEWLNRSASLPAARWSGGPVEAGGEYRINELGQEAFLSAGRLSLIDSAPNSIWRAPSEGVVIPAGITARIKAQAAAVPVGGIGGSTGVAELAIEVGKLRQEVGNLARRDWSVRVTQRTGPTGSQVLRTLLS